MTAWSRPFAPFPSCHVGGGGGNGSLTDIIAWPWLPPPTLFLMLRDGEGRGASDFDLRFQHFDFDSIFFDFDSSSFKTSHFHEDKNVR